MEIKTYQRLLFSVLTGCLLSASWPANGVASLIFLAFVPLLWVEDYFSRKQESTWHSVLGYSYLSFLIWNVLTTYWVWNSTAVGGVLAFTLNSLFMSLVFTLFHIIHKRIGSVAGYAALVTCWISYEYLHQHWDLSWTWLTLGNVFSENYTWIQWYEFTGVFGGTAWVWTGNVLITHFLISLVSGKTNAVSIRKRITTITFLLVLPISISKIMYHNYSEAENPVEVVVVQPNIDPYNEKFDGLTAAEQLDRMLNLASSAITAKTNYLVGPETALVEGILENNIEEFQSIKTIRGFLSKFPDLHVVIGLSSYREFLPGEPISTTARTFQNGKTFDAYNTAAQIDTTPRIQIYHKSKLVPGVEKMPFSKLLKPLEEIAFNLGGTSGSLGVQAERTVFKHAANKKLCIAPVVCYESIYGEYVGDYIKNGASLIFIVTNDGWWGNTPGYKQHCSYARLRAIEHRRSIARSANTGISCFINQRGDMAMATPYWQPAAIKRTINANNTLTVYSNIGDVLAYASMLLSALFIGYALANKKYSH